MGAQIDIATTTLKPLHFRRFFFMMNDLQVRTRAGISRPMEQIISQAVSLKRLEIGTRAARPITTIARQ